MSTAEFATSWEDMVNRRRKDWKQLAQEAGEEKEPHKLLSLISELNAALEERVNKLRDGVAVPTTISTTEAPSKRLLFVDDEEGIRLTLSQILQTRGFNVRVAGSVPEALAEIDNHKFDVLLSDLNLGKEGDGFAVVRAMLEAHPNCVTILLTGYPAFETAVQAIRDEVDDYFVKPADIDPLLSTIERRLARRGRFRSNYFSEVSYRMVVPTLGHSGAAPASSLFKRSGILTAPTVQAYVFALPLRSGIPNQPRSP